MNIFKTALAAGVFAVVGSVASAATVSGTDTDVSATINVTYIGTNGSNWIYEVSVTNDDTSLSSSRLASFYLGTTPDSTIVDQDLNTAALDFIYSDPSATDTDVFVAADQVVSLSPFNSITFDFCFQADTNGNCTGGNGGLAEGETDVFQIEVTASSQPTFNIFGARWQSIVGDPNTSSDKGVCDNSNGACDDPGGPPEVPLPAAGWLLLGGVGALAATKRKRKAA